MLTVVIAILWALLFAFIVGFVFHQIKPEWEHFAFTITFLVVLLMQLGVLH